MLTGEHVEDLLTKFKSLNIGVLGDFCLDKYLEIDSCLQETSLETGRVAHQVYEVRCSPGGAGNVAANLAALGVGSIRAIGPLGDDGEGFELRRCLSNLGIDQTYLLSHSAYLTPTYTKPMLHQKEHDPIELDRLDIRARKVLPTDLENTLCRYLEDLVPTLDGLIVVDQFEIPNQKTVTRTVRDSIRALALQNPDKVIFVDSRSQAGDYSEVILKPNHAEAARALGDTLQDESFYSVAMTGLKLSKRTNRNVYLTIGEKGILVCNGNQGSVFHVPGYQVPPPVDICGAGDSTTAGIVSALSAGADPLDSAVMGCLVASITVQQIGVTGTASPAQVKQRFLEYSKKGLCPSKII